MRDIPSIRSVSLTPASGVLRAGQALTLTLHAAWNESGLLPLPTSCCIVNGVNVVDTYRDNGDGSYTLVYTVGAGDDDVFLSAPRLTIALVDAVYSDAVSDGVSRSLVSQYAGLSVDTHAPAVTLLNVAWNGTVRPTTTENVTVSCGIVTFEATLGCRVHYWVGGAVSGSASGVFVANMTDATNGTIRLAFRNGDAPVVRLWAVDGAGNVGANVTLSWSIDAEWPVTEWPPLATPGRNGVVLSSDTEPSFVYSCSRSGCHFSYSLDRGSFTAVGNASASDASTGQDGGSSPPLDTVVALMSPRVTASTTLSLAVAAFAYGLPLRITATGNSTVELRVDGGFWIDVRAYPDWNNVTGTVTVSVVASKSGVHVVDARTTDGFLGMDATMASVVWQVVKAGPAAVFVAMPPPTSPTPATSAQFAVRCEPPLGCLLQYALATVSGSGGNTSWLRPEPVNGTTASTVPVWVNTSGNAVSLSGLTPGLAYRLYLRATDVLGNVGLTNTWTWRSDPCLSATEAAIQQLAVTLVSSGTRVASWSSVARPDAISGYSYAVDSGPWRVTPVPHVVLRGLQLGVTHVFRVKVALTTVCGDYSVSSVSWRRLRTRALGWRPVLRLVRFVRGL